MELLRYRVGVDSFLGVRVAIPLALDWAGGEGESEGSVEVEVESEGVVVDLERREG